MNKIKIEISISANGKSIKKKSEKRITESRHTPLKLRVVAGDEGESSF